MKRLFLVLGMLVTCTPCAHGYLLVEDIPSLTTNIINEIKNYAQYVIQSAHQVTQITNQYTQILNEYTQLARFGNPQYYVNLLNLNEYTATVGNLVQGVGQTVSQIEQAADGVAALGYTANGLYQDLSHVTDRFGYAVNYSTNSFRKFSAINDGAQAFDRQLGVYDQQMNSLGNQLLRATQSMNADSTQEGRARYGHQIEGIHAQMDALHAQTILKGQRVEVQDIKNRNDASRVQEASRQQLEQERNEDLQRMSTGMANWLYQGSN